MAGLSITNITKRFGDTEVLKGVSLDIADGEFISLVGPSGCGKSTLLRIIAGLEDQSTGEIKLAGNDVSGVRAADRNLSMVFQSYALYPHLSVADNIAVPLRMRQQKALQRLPMIGRFVPGQRQIRHQITRDIRNAADMLEIAPLLERKPGQLSGGQRQRVALARALVRDPAAFLLDEPLSNLDAKLRVQTRVEIAQLHRKLGATFVYVTHDQVEAMTMSSRIAVMMGGRILQCAEPDTVYHDPEDIQVAEFIGSPKINILPVDQNATGALGLLGQALHLQVEQKCQSVRIGLRPEMLRLSGEQSLLTGTVEHLENLGAELFAQIAVPGLENRLVLRCDPSQRAAVRLGATVGLDFTPAQALLFDQDGTRIRRVHDTSRRPVSTAEVVQHGRT
ncbi:Maltose/maltodextrin import ATP-binding protein MalK [Phaeobacter sp. CECT 5382]|uniref:ABC transporter ATP-binding protein n=1 Tax=Phaeobacter sp. CECT 5382 TaxID=1712645 RepID=UPI0006DB7080|nr:ABC transporter ATP-binding protein [Phaeobacter sp. CECT 5382]CUH88067.1 Maltose/maltodextrin import ATP-binding protein MalK [Phaeobacter sp. CECT 5382]